MPGDSLTSGRSLRARRAAANERRFLQPSEPRTHPASERWRLTVRGQQVQGVGYRAACRNRASELGLGGWVRNVADGSVEVEAEGDPLRLGELRLWCEHGPASAIVSSVMVVQQAPTGADWFDIRR